MEKMSVQNVENFIKESYSSRSKAAEMCVSLLASNEFPTHSIEFDWENSGDAPCISSSEASNGTSIEDCAISRLYTENGELYADLHCYELGDNVEHINLKYDTGTDYIDLLEYINNHRTDDKPTHLIVDTKAGEVMLKQQDNGKYIDAYIGYNYDNYIGEFRGTLDDDLDYLTTSANYLLD